MSRDVRIADMRFTFSVAGELSENRHLMADQPHCGFFSFRLKEIFAASAGGRRFNLFPAMTSPAAGL
jgi:hypothetical protein